MQVRTPKKQHSARGRVARLVGGCLLVGLLLIATLYNSELYALFDAAWQKLFAALGLTQHLPALLQSGGAVSQVMHRPHSVPAVLSYSLFYIGVCVALLFLLLPQARQRRLVLAFYGLAAGAALALLAASRVGGIPALAVLNTQLVHFIVSPLPVFVLVPLLRWYLPAASTE